MRVILSYASIGFCWPPCQSWGNSIPSFNGLYSPDHSRFAQATFLVMIGRSWIISCKKEGPICLLPTCGSQVTTFPKNLQGKKHGSCVRAVSPQFIPGRNGGRFPRPETYVLRPRFLPDGVPILPGSFSWFGSHDSSPLRPCFPRPR